MILQRHKWDMLQDDNGVCRCVRCRTIWTKANRFAEDCPDHSRLASPPPVVTRLPHNQG